MQTSTAIILVGGAGALGLGAYFLLRRPAAPGPGQVFVPGVSSTDGAAKIVPLGATMAANAAVAVGAGSNDAGTLIAAGVPTQVARPMVPGPWSDGSIYSSSGAAAVAPAGTAAAAPWQAKAVVTQGISQAVGSAGRLVAASGLQQIASGNIKGGVISAITSPITVGKTAVSTAVSTTRSAVSGVATGVKQIFALF